MNETYRWLFPFEHIERGSRVLIYGAGNLGQAYLKQLIMTGYANVVGVVDRFADKVPHMVVPVYKPDQINSLEFDFVAVALRGKVGYSEIHRILLEQGVQEDRIIFISERINEPSSVFLESQSSADAIQVYAYTNNAPSVACYLLGGLGDFIIQKRFIMALCEILPKIKVDIFVVHNTEFLELLYRDMPEIHSIIMNTGKEFERLQSRYAASFEICGGGFLKIVNLKNELFPSDVQQKFNRLREIIEEEDYDKYRAMGLMYARRIRQGLNCFTGFSYNGIFPIRDWHVPITLNEPDNVVSVLCDKHYITVNGGNGDAKDGSLIAKTWSSENFERFIQLFSEEYPDVSVVQVGAADNLRFEKAAYHFMGTSFDTVGHILKNALFHVDIEGGMVHFATQLGTKCIVLFGPTPVRYYGYETNVNLLAGKCHGCYGYYTDINRCAKEEKRPSCMTAITPEMVFEAAKRLVNRAVKVGKH